MKLVPPAKSVNLSSWNVAAIVKNISCIPTVTIALTARWSSSKISTAIFPFPPASPSSPRPPPSLLHPLISIFVSLRRITYESVKHFIIITTIIIFFSFFLFCFYYYLISTKYEHWLFQLFLIVLFSFNFYEWISFMIIQYLLTSDNTRLFIFSNDHIDAILRLVQSFYSIFYIFYALTHFIKRPNYGSLLPCTRRYVCTICTRRIAEIKITKNERE